MHDESCPICGSSLKYVRCWQCGGYGDIDISDDNGPRDSLRCNVCDGRGGWWVCMNVKNHEAATGGETR